MSINLTVVPVEWAGTQDQLPRHPRLCGLRRRGDGGAARGRCGAGGGLGGKGRRGRHGAGLARTPTSTSLPRLVFVNKLDRENTSYDRALESLRSHFGTGVAPLTIPIGEQASFSGVVDLVSGKAYTFAERQGDRGRDSRRDGRGRRALPRATGRERRRERRRPDGRSTWRARRSARPSCAAPSRRVSRRARWCRCWPARPARTSACSQLLDAITEYLPSAAERAWNHSRWAAGRLRLQDHRRSAEGDLLLLPRLQRHGQVRHAPLQLKTATDERLGQLQTMRGKLQEPVTEVAGRRHRRGDRA